MAKQEAVAWYGKAAEQGFAKAQAALGRCYANGEGVAQDYGVAVQWYHKAAEQGEAKAQNDLGVRYESGTGVAQNCVEAVKWYRKAAEQGDARGQNSLGVRYSRGQGVAQDYMEAVKWYRKAAEQGYTNAQCNLGSCYALGHGVPQDYVEAANWFHKAAERGDAHAQNSLGLSYEKGRGVSLDFAEAIKWYIKALEQGYEPARTNLARAKAEQAYAHPSNDSTRRTSRPLTPPATPSQNSALTIQPYRRGGTSGSVYISKGGGHWIESVIDDGNLIKLEDNSVWQVSPLNVIDSALWLPISDVTVMDGDDFDYPYKLINKDDNEVVSARLLSH